MIRYLVVRRPSFNWSQPGAYQPGTVISRHRSIKAAKAVIDRAMRKLRKQAGMSSSWYDWHICAEEDGFWRRLTAMEQDALADLGSEA